jgi:hypothetical protein
MDRPNVKERLGECHSYVMDTYIDVTWMTKKEKLLFYNRLTTRIFYQCILHVQMNMKTRQ